MTRPEFLRQEIDRYRRKIETYQAMITEWEAELGIHAVTPPLAPQAEPNGGKKLPTDGPLSLVQGMVFFGKSQPEAAKAFLEMVGYPLTTGQVLEGIEKGGVPVGGKDAGSKKTNLYTILNRSSEFARVRKDTWALIGWPGVPKKTSDDAEQENSNGASEEAKKTATESKP